MTTDKDAIMNERKGRPVYLDYQATTPVDPRALAAMQPFFAEKFGNPHSSSHFYGWEASDAVELARAEVAALIGADAREIVFTSGATESNNLAIKGIARFHKGSKRRGRAQPGQGQERNHVVTVATEHKCVLESCRALEDEGFEVTYLPVDGNGLLELDRLSDAITEKTALVSVMGVNNEIGVIQPLAEIGAICRERGAFFHTDCAQAAGRIGLDVEAMAIDLMSLSGHKVYGPMGIGALYVRRRPRVRLEPLFSGGGQERGLRSGTLPAPLVVGFGMAARIAAEELDAEAERLSGLRDRFVARIRAAAPDAVLNGDAERRVPGNLNYSFPGVRSDDLMAAVPEIAVSSGSACSSASVEPSYVLRALGLSDELAAASVRIGFGRFTTESEIDFAADAIAEAAKRLAGGNQGQQRPTDASAA